jgi:hypothetical protein
MRRAYALACALAACGAGCTSFGLTTTVIDTPNEYVPRPFKGDTEPALTPTDVTDLYRVESLGPNVYYDGGQDLWYRRARRQWYQAFRWNGNWFIVSKTPALLVGREIEKVSLPTLPQEDDDMVFDEQGLPTLPDLEDVPDEDDPVQAPP